MERAAQKWRSLPGPDAWTQSLFRIEALARSARQVGDWPFAARMAQLMLEHDPDYAGTHYALALVAQHDGNDATARREFDLALKAWATADKDLAGTGHMPARNSGWRTGATLARQVSSIPSEVTDDAAQ